MNLNLLVVDDEPLVRKGLRSILSELSDELKITQVYEAEDGLRALNILNQEEIDVVFTDIKMPNMDGIALLSWISASKPDCISVVLSCHDDYDFVRQAFKQKVVDYILKYDIDREIIKQTIVRALERRELLKQITNSEIINHAIDTEAVVRRIEEYKDELGESAFFRLVVIYVPKPLSEDKQFFLDKNIGMSLKKCTQRLVVPDIHFKALPFSRSLYLVIQSSPVTITRGNLERFYQAVIEDVSRMVSQTVSILVSSEKKWRSSISSLLEQIQNAEEFIFLTGPALHWAENELFFGQTVFNKNLLAEFKVDLYKLLDDKSLPSLKNKLEELAGYITRENSFSIQLVKSFYLELADLLVVFYREALILEYNSEVIQEVKNAIKSAGYFSVVHEALLKLIDQFLLNSLSNYHSGEISIGIRRAVSCIHSNFEKKNFSLSDVAQMLNYSLSYLSRQFKKEIGLSIVTYINDLRLEESKKLLATKKYMVYEVAHLVGFNNYNYFSKIYKKRYGVSPANDDI